VVVPDNSGDLGICVDLSKNSFADLRVALHLATLLQS
jgi:hypothetical protein